MRLHEESTDDTAYPGRRGAALRLRRPLQRASGDAQPAGRDDLRPRPTAEFEALRTEIHQIGNNINQIARKANAGFASHDEVTRALRMLDAVYGLLYEAGK